MSIIIEQAMRMQAKVEELRTHRAEHLAKVAQEVADLARPMVERVRDAIAAMPPEDVASGIKLEQLAGMIKGRYKGHAQPKEVAAALRALNFERIRCWRDTDLGFRSTWHRKEDK